MKLLIPVLLLLLLFPAQAPAQENACEPFALRCEGKTVQQCNSLGTQWVGIENCSTSCFNAQCDPELRIKWELLATGLTALVIIVVIVRILWKRRKSQNRPRSPPEKAFISIPEIMLLCLKGNPAGKP